MKSKKQNFKQNNFSKSNNLNQEDKKEKELEAFKESFTKLDQEEIEHLKELDKKYKDRAKERREAESKGIHIENIQKPLSGLDFGLLYENTNEDELDFEKTKFTSDSNIHSHGFDENQPDPSTAFGRRIVNCFKSDENSNYNPNTIIHFYNDLTSFKKTLKVARNKEKEIFPKSRNFLFETLSRSRVRQEIKLSKSIKANEIYEELNEEDNIFDDANENEVTEELRRILNNRKLVKQSNELQKDQLSSDDNVDQTNIEQTRIIKSSLPSKRKAEMPLDDAYMECYPDLGPSIGEIVDASSHIWEGQMIKQSFKKTQKKQNYKEQYNKIEKINENKK